MAKQAKSKPATKGAGKRSAPYAKAAPGKKAKPSVEVRYDGEAPPSKAVKAASSKPAPKAAVKAVEPKSKGKEKAVGAPAAATIPEPAPTPATPASTFKIIAGSYEKLLYGLEGTYADGDDKPTLTPIFIFPAHLSWVKAAAASPGGKWLATGSEDEFVKVWDLRRRKEVGSLSQHQGEWAAVELVARSAGSEASHPE